MQPRLASRSHSAAEIGLKFPTFLPFKCWNYRHGPIHQKAFTLEIDSKYDNFCQLSIVKNKVGREMGGVGFLRAFSCYSNAGG